jgi:ABC-type uncharacterized transport system involved in gliding motility auxiliary subunit
METLVINIPDKKSDLVKQLLKELGVTINPATVDKNVKSKNIPNPLTAKTIEDAHNGIGLEKPIKNIKEFMKSL